MKQRPHLAVAEDPSGGKMTDADRRLRHCHRPVVAVAQLIAAHTTRASEMTPPLAALQLQSKSSAENYPLVEQFDIPRGAKPSPGDQHR